MLWIQDGNPIYQHIFGISNLNPTQRMGYDSPAYDTDILGTIHNKTGPNYRTGSQTNRRIARYLDFPTRQILRKMYPRTEVNQSRILFKHVLCVLSFPINRIWFFPRIGLGKHVIGKDMKVLLALTIKFHAQEFRTMQSKLHGTCIHLTTSDATRGRLHFYLHFAIPVPCICAAVLHSDHHGTSHLEFSKRSMAHMSGIHITP